MSNREIQFRCWNGVEMFNVEEIDFIEDVAFEQRNIRGSGGDYCHFGKNETGKLMQFTGLHDKNGKEIYEGDIVKLRFKKSNDELFVVEWAKDECGFRPFLEESGYSSKQFEVSGNVYENKDLIISPENN